jgi:hypothetical protein
VSILAATGDISPLGESFWLFSALSWWPTPLMFFFASFVCFGAASFYHVRVLNRRQKRPLGSSVVGWFSVAFTLLLLVPMAFIPQYLIEHLKL